MDAWDSLLELVGAKRLMDRETFILWGTSMTEPCLAIAKHFDGNSATVGNGVMVALQAESKELVAALHGKALELEGQDEGAPGPRGDGFYAGYFRGAVREGPSRAGAKWRDHVQYPLWRNPTSTG